MRKFALITFSLLMGALSLAAQQGASLGVIARQARSERRAEPKPSLVFTNDNLPSAKPNEAISTLSIPTEPSAATPSKSVAKTDEVPAPEAKEEKTEATPVESPEDKIKTQDYWQAKFRSARNDVAKAKEHEQLSEDELSLLQIRQVRELDPMAKDGLTAQVQAKQSEVDVNQSATEAAQKTLEALTKEFENSGAPEDWSKTD